MLADHLVTKAKFLLGHMNLRCTDCGAVPYFCIRARWWYNKCTDLNDVLQPWSTVGSPVSQDYLSPRAPSGIELASINSNDWSSYSLSHKRK